MNQPLVVIKRTKWERDLERFGSEARVRELYRIQNDAYARVFESHLRQRAALDKLRRALPDARFVSRSEFLKTKVDEFPYVVSLGGDNHFVHVSQLVGDRPLAGVNSDPATSIGALLYFDADTFLEGMPRDRAPEFDIDLWTRIDGEIESPGGEIQKVAPCTSEISLRHEYPEYASRYLIRVGGAWEEQKSSGLLMATGTGSTGWYRNCFPPGERAPASFVRSAPFFRFFAREVGSPPGRGKKHLSGQVDEDQVLEIVSEMDGIISVDAIPDSTFAFPPACTARFRISKDRLRVIRDLH